MTPSHRARLVLRKLEQAFVDESGRDRGPWVTTLELQRAAGVGFKVGIHELHNKKKPEKGLGFVIARRWEEEPDQGRPCYGYMIVGYPAWWGRGGWDVAPDIEDEDDEAGSPCPADRWGVDGPQHRMFPVSSEVVGGSDPSEGQALRPRASHSEAMG